MDILSNNNYLCRQLLDINKKYESSTFIDIDFIDLFNLYNQSYDDLNILKKKITAKYYNLALKYHPDKYININEEIINIKNCYITIDELKSGSFISFINDIYEMLINMIIQDTESLINLINGYINLI
jgi:hypothetical protein